MIILGMDPGTTRAGYGAISVTGKEIGFVGAGVLKVPKEGETATRLDALRSAMKEVCARFKPDLVAVEKLFFAKNRKTALQVAEARGVILMSAAENGCEVVEYSPNEVKLAVTGNGSADKKAVMKMVGLVLKKPGLKMIDDASDALAIAITAALRHDKERA